MQVAICSKHVWCSPLILWDSSFVCPKALSYVLPLMVYDHNPPQKTVLMLLEPFNNRESDLKVPGNLLPFGMILALVAEKAKVHLVSSGQTEPETWLTPQSASVWSAGDGRFTWRYTLARTSFLPLHCFLYSLQVSLGIASIIHFLSLNPHLTHYF